jgi:hypothetical protein
MQTLTACTLAFAPPLFEINPRGPAQERLLSTLSVLP